MASSSRVPPSSVLRQFETEDFVEETPQQRRARKMAEEQQNVDVKRLYDDFMGQFKGPLPELIRGERKLGDLFKRREEAEKEFGGIVPSKLKGIRGVVPDDIKSVQNSRLKSWLKQNGVYLEDASDWGLAPHSCVLVSEIQDDNAGESAGRGLVAARQVIKGTELFSIPLQLCITKTRAMEIFGKDVIDFEMSDHVAVALLLIHEKAKGQDSFWYPYLSVLPPIDEINPTFVWPEEDLQLLEASEALVATRAIQRKLERSYLELTQTLFKDRPDLFPLDVFTFEAYLWAMVQVTSRCVSLLPTRSEDRSRDPNLPPGNEEYEGRIIGMVPYADLLNHSPFSVAFMKCSPPSAFIKRFRGEGVGSFFTYTGDDVKVVTDRAYRATEQFYISYGAKPNHELLVQYGFSLERNPHNAVPLRFQMLPDLPMYKEKIEFLKANDLDPDLPQAFPLGEDRYSSEMIEYLRLLLIDEETLKELGARDLFTLDFTRVTTERLENEIVDVIVEAAEEVLKGYPTSIEEDEELVNNKSIFSVLSKRQRMAIRMRLLEKRLLKRNIAALNARRKLIKSQVQQREKGLDIPPDMVNISRHRYYQGPLGNVLPFDTGAPA
uniref:SET domain-containing protein n=1 Tax=Chromera velia CCMP2878 TaxID=1169474 RepID=A0A0G4ICM2_9ALVE|eukprot:Cvel_13070.t1-p1 / transcript=Cvel_13070.t1 / gene=Cvel_13070 / organism=Chromera_velia_CCMP2878 / gene_product=Histone-lysine N-methyltransferase setd3, putative / transcript_product=Histone-lysine N-methyltransferase setd3, putative / location=Cvel_scaffold880:13510-19082(-) / protein_length=606 / sequence_SO=supercontig / SO=protein_coding / is_pseudo=false